MNLTKNPKGTIFNKNINVVIEFYKTLAKQATREGSVKANTFPLTHKAS